MQLGTLLVKEKIKKDDVKQEKIFYEALDLGKQDINKQKNIPDKYTLHAKYFGIATHFCLEMMKDFTLNSLEYCLQLTKSKYSNYLNEEDFIDIKNRILLLIHNEQFQDMIKESSFTKEQALKYNNELKIIDLLVKKREKIFDI